MPSLSEASQAVIGRPTRFGARSGCGVPQAATLEPLTMGALASQERAWFEAASAEPMLAQVENWANVNSGSRNLDGLAVIGARLGGGPAPIAPGDAGGERGGGA